MMTLAAPRTPARSLERQIERDTSIEFTRRVLSRANRIHLAVVADRLDIADQSAGELVVLANRRLRQLGDAA